MQILLDILVFIRSLNFIIKTKLSYNVAARSVYGVSLIKFCLCQFHEDNSAIYVYLAHGIAYQEVFAPKRKSCKIAANDWSTDLNGEKQFRP